MAFIVIHIFPTGALVVQLLLNAYFSLLKENLLSLQFCYCKKTHYQGMLHVLLELFQMFINLRLVFFIFHLSSVVDVFVSFFFCTLLKNKHTGFSLI